MKACFHKDKHEKRSGGSVATTRFFLVKPPEKSATPSKRGGATEPSGELMRLEAEQSFDFRLPGFIFRNFGRHC